MPIDLGLENLRLFDLSKTEALGALAVVFDILIVAYVIYRVMLIIRGTRAVSLLKGIAVLLLANLASSLLGLRAVNWLLEKTITMVFVALPIVFLPEIRRALEHIGRGHLISSNLDFFGREDMHDTVEAISRAASLLSQSKTGALIVLERETGVRDLVETGVRIDALVTSELLLNIFCPDTPLHDGAVIIKGSRVLSAGSYLPLTDNPSVSRNLGTRHRAALGISEQTDAVCVVVSEETGTISIAEGGTLESYLNEDSLRERLTGLLEVKTPSWWSARLPKWLTG